MFSSLRFILLAVLVLASTACTTAQPEGASPGTAGTSITSEATPGFETIERASLPPEARTTLDLIERGGPYPYKKDGTVFANRERLLPQRPRGYYREFTVPTPGENDRGARRVISGREGELFYTPDHYRTFLLITG